MEKQSIAAARLAPLNKELPLPVVRALIALLCAKAKVELIQPISERIKNDALQKYPVFVEDNDLGRILKRVGEAITNFDDLYLASDSDTNIIYSYHKQRLEDEGFVAPGMRCPLLIAENLECNYRDELFSVMEPYTGVSGLIQTEHIKRYEQLLIPFLVQAAVNQGIELNPYKNS